MVTNKETEGRFRRQEKPNVWQTFALDLHPSKARQR